MSKITDFCMAECERQNDFTTLAVANMVEAWYIAVSMQEGNSLFRPASIAYLGGVVKPQNGGLFRNTPVVFQDGKRGIDAYLIPRAIKNLCGVVDALNPEEWYKEFEEIHPFEDGNGRVGAILYNALKDTMFDPIVPPDFWK